MTAIAVADIYRDKLDDERLIEVRRALESWSRRVPRYVVFSPNGDGLVDENTTTMDWSPVMGAHMYMYKTTRGARAAAGVSGVILAADLSQLPIVDDSEGLAEVGAGRTEVGESMFCERQALLWMQRAERLRKDGR